MMILALERSTALPSAALLHLNGTCIGQVHATQGLQDDPDALVQNLLETTQTDLSQISRFAVGTGPGSFSGIRAALAYLAGLALPQNGAVQGVSSAVALWTQFHAAHPEFPSAVILGDARRGRLWFSHLSPSSQPTHTADDFIIVPQDQLTQALPPSTPIVTPDWHRLAPFLQSIVPASLLFSDIPLASTTAQLALQNSCGSPLPIYLHPAVAPRA